MITRRTILSLAAGVVAGMAAIVSPAAAEGKPKLTVYSYKSFTGKYGPGKTVKARFEAECGCELEWVAADDTGALAGRLKLEGEATKADVVLGLDMNLADEARATGLFAPHGQSLDGLSLPVAWSDREFIPFDYGHLAFIYDETRLKTPPASLKELVDNAAGPKLVIQDPRTSAPGLGFLLWMRKVYGSEADAAWARLRPRVVTFTKGWSEAYELFLKGEADMVMSYVTSPAYHIGVEKETRYKAAAFAEGHYLHVEIAGMTRTSKQPELARRFLAFVLSPAFQDAMPEGNWMMPVRMPKDGLPKSFETVLKPATTLLYAPAEVSAGRRAFIDGWLAATTR